MISSKPTECFLDHDQVEDFDGRIYVVVGNTHPPNSVIAYVKYVPTERSTLWCRGSVCYERVIRRYGVDSVLSAAKKLQEEAYEPSLGVSVPVVKLNNVATVYRPRERFEEILRRSDDRVELDVLIAFDRVRESSRVPSWRVGVGGSIAIGIHNPLVSDVDLVVYGCREALDVVESTLNSFDRVPDDVEAARLAGMSRTYRLPIHVLRSISAPYKRLYMRDRRREVNLMFSSDTPGRHGESVLVPVALAEADVVVNSADCRSLFYPGVSSVDKVIDLKIFKIIRDDYVNLLKRFKLAKIVTYESLYSFPLYRGGEIKVRGVVSVEKPSEDLVMTIGTREVDSYAIPKKLSSS
ncbi:MAG: hypothetical protein RMI56_03410 [Sulfolobales archaeon]|nr:hypothetical protein [Sulfolobales archaeon]MDW8082828.1 hypothetical protein [Sulfolobales archaeon]